MDFPRMASGVVGPFRPSGSDCALRWGLLLVLLLAGGIARGQQIERLPPVNDAPAQLEQLTPPDGTAQLVPTTVPGGYPGARLSHSEPAAPEPFAHPDQFFRLAAAQEGADEAPADPAPAGDTPANDDANVPKGPDGQPLTYGQKPTSNALQFLRTQNVLLAPGKWQADTGFAYTNFDQLAPAGVTSGGTFLTGVVQGHLRRRILYTPLAFRYGITENVQFFSYMPVGYSNTQISTLGTSSSTNVGGQGDLTAGLNMHLFEACGDRPDVIMTIATTAPTGPYSVPLFGLVPGSNLGQGFWALQGQLLFVNRYDPIIVFYGFGYRHLFQRDFGGIQFAPGEQINYQFGVGFSANDRVTLSATFLGFYITPSVQSNAVIPGSNIEPLSMRFAATIARRDRILEPYAILGVTQFAPTASIGVTVTFY